MLIKNMPSSVDDMVDSGGTLCKAQKLTLNAGAPLGVRAYITHGIPTGDALSKD